MAISLRSCFGTWLQVFLFVIVIRHNRHMQNLTKFHYEFAVTILEVFWCGCLPQMKENRQAYHPGATDTFRQIIIDAFDAGRRVQ